MQGAGPLTQFERIAYQSGCRNFEHGNDSEALKHFTELLETREGFADVHYRIGVLLERQDDLPSAEESLRRAIHLNPSYAEARLALATIYERQGDFDRSREIASPVPGVGKSSAGTLDPTTRGKLANLQAEMGDAYRDVGELRDAIEAYRKALDRCPNFHDIRFRLGIVLRDAGLPSQSLTEFRRVMRGNPSFLDAAVQLGLTLYSLGRTDAAVEQWNAVLKQEPTHRDAAMYLRLVQKGS
jgi:tetratricopeptide (TPR) repeat protein